MSKQNESLEKLEEQIPERVSYALRSAYKTAINSGHFVVVARRGRIVRISPNLEEVALGRIPAPTKVQKGSRFKLA